MHQLNSTKRARVTSNAIHLPGSRILHYVRFRYPIDLIYDQNKKRSCRPLVQPPGPFKKCAFKMVSTIYDRPPPPPLKVDPWPCMKVYITVGPKC
jgi:hypothetical protein